MSTLPLYWKLSSSSKNERLGASVELISALEQFQEQHVPPSEGTNSEDSEEEDADQLMASLETLNSEDVRYAIKRLIRGLGSPKESSRLGFAVVLTELLSRLRTITAKQIIQLVIENSQIAGSMKGQEIRDMLFARLFGMTSVIQSNLLFRTEPIPNSDSPPALLSDFSTVIIELISVGEKKSWLRESAWWSILLAVEGLYTSQVEWKAEASQLTISRLFSNLKDVTSETIALALKMQPLFPALDWKAVLVPAFKNGNILSPDSLRILARVFRDAPSLDDDNEDIKHHNVGHWNPQLHFVWDIIFTRYLDPSLQAYNLPDTSTIFDFYRVVVDESLFSSTSSPERKSWGFQVVQKLLGRIPNADIPLLFTQNFMRSWTNHLSGKDRYLHKEAVKVASAIQSVAASNPNVGYTLLLTLVGKDHKQFDNLTKTKTIESILTALDVQGVQGYVDYLIKKAAEATQDSDPMSTTRNHTWVADQLVTLIRSASVPNNDEWITMALQFLLLHSFFVVKKRDGKSPIKALQVAGKVGLTEDGHGIIRIRLYSTLAHLIGNHHSRHPASSKDQPTSVSSHERVYWIKCALETIEVLEKNTKHVDLVRSDDDEVVKLRRQLRSTLDHLNVESEERQNTLKGAELLLSSQLLLTYDEKVVGLEAFEQCDKAIRRLFPLSTSKKPSKKKKHQSPEADDEDEDLEPIDIVIDVLIGCMEDNEASTSFTRETADIVLGLMSGELKQSSIDLLTTQLVPRDPLADEEEEEEELSGEELEAMEAALSESESSDDQSDAEDGHEDDTEDTGDEEVDPELRKRIAQALNAQGMTEAEMEDGNVGGTGEESEEEILMDDDQMMALDEKLADIFRSTNKAMKKKRQDAQRAANVFRGRILDLIETFIKRQPASKFIIHFIQPLLEVAINSSPEEQHLSGKASKLLQNRISQLKEPIPDLDVEKASELLQELHEWAKRAKQSAQTTKSLSQASLYISRLLIQHQHADEVERIYLNSLEDFIFKKKSKLSIELIQDFIRRNPSLGWKFRNVLVKGLGTESDVGAFKRSHILQLIRDIFSQCHAEADFVDGYVDFMESCANALRDTVTEANKDPRSVSSQKLRELLQFALAAVKQSKKASEIHPSITLIWNSDEWQKLMEELATKEQYNSSKPLLQISQELVKSISSLPRTSKHPPETKKQRAPKPNVPNNKEEGNQTASASTSQKSDSKKGKKTAKAIVTEEAHEAEEPMKSMSINGSTETREANKKRKGSVPNTNSEDTQNVEDSIPKKKRKKSKITQDS